MSVFQRKIQKVLLGLCLQLFDTQGQKKKEKNRCAVGFLVCEREAEKESWRNRQTAGGLVMLSWFVISDFL